MKSIKAIQIGTLVSVPGPVFDQRPGRKPRRLYFDGKITALYQAKGGQAAKVDFLGLGDKLGQGKYLIRDLSIAQFVSTQGTRFDALKEKLGVTDEELSQYGRK